MRRRAAEDFSPSVNLGRDGDDRRAVAIAGDHARARRGSQPEFRIGQSLGWLQASAIDFDPVVIREDTDDERERLLKILVASQTALKPGSGGARQTSSPKACPPWLGPAPHKADGFAPPHKIVDSQKGNAIPRPGSLSRRTGRQPRPLPLCSRGRSYQSVSLPIADSVRSIRVRGERGNVAFAY